MWVGNTHENTLAYQMTHLLSFVSFSGYISRLNHNDFYSQIYHEWNVFDVFVTTGLQEVLKIDSKYDTHEMSRYVDQPEMVEKVYDKVAYEKGKVSRIEFQMNDVKYSFSIICILQPVQFCGCSCMHSPRNLLRRA